MGLVLVVLSSSCSDSRTLPSDTEPPSPREPKTVTVTSRDIFRTTLLSGVVEPNPRQPILAPVAGQVVLTPGLARGSIVKANQQVGSIRGCEGSAGEPTPAQPAAGSESTAKTGCRVTWTALRAPTSGTLSGVTQRAEAGAAVATVDPGGYRLIAPIEDAEARWDLRHPPRTARGTIVGGPGDLRLEFIRRVYSEEGQTTSLELAIPESVDAVAGLEMKAALVVARRDDVPSLPMTAVEGAGGAHRVIVVSTNGDKRVEQITLGARDGTHVEVDGLSLGTRVIDYPLPSDFDDIK